MTHLVIILYLPTTAAVLAAAVTLSFRTDERPAVAALYAAATLSALWFASDYLLNNRLAVPEWLPPAIRSAAMVPFVVAAIAVTALLEGGVARTGMQRLTRLTITLLSSAAASLFVVSKIASAGMFPPVDEEMGRWPRLGSYGASSLLFLCLLALGVLNLMRGNPSPGRAARRWFALLLVLIPLAFLLDVVVVRMRIPLSSAHSRAAFPVCFFTFGCWAVLLIVRYRRSTRSQDTLAPAGDEGAVRLIAARYGLSRREEEVTERLLAGLNNRDIAQALCISPHTVKNHVYSIFRKTGARGRFDLVRLAGSGPTGESDSRTSFMT